MLDEKHPLSKKCHFFVLHPTLKRDGNERFYLVPMLQRGNPYGMHSHAGAWERETLKLSTYFLGLLKNAVGKNKN